MSNFLHCLLIASTLMLVGCSTTKEHSVSVSPICLSIPLNTHGERTAVVDCHPPCPLHVLLTNVGRKPVKLWDGWVSWGYYSLQLAIIGPDGQERTLTKRPADFYSNGPAFFVLQPNESAIWEVELSSNVWQDLSWIPSDKQLTLQARAVYTVEPDDYSQKLGVWTGRVESQPCDILIYRAPKNESP